MARGRANLIDLLRMSRAWQTLVRKSQGDIDDAMRFVDFHEEIGKMCPREAAVWRSRIMACWAEQHRKPRAARTPARERTGRVIRLEPRRGCAFHDPHPSEA